MMVRDLRSIFIIFLFILLNLSVVGISYFSPIKEEAAIAQSEIAPEFTEVDFLDYFFSKKGVPQLSLSANKMISQQDNVVEFEQPRGVYNYVQKNKSLRYEAKKGYYKKSGQVLTLEEEVKLKSDESQYFADRIKYFLDKDLITGKGNVHFMGTDLKTGDEVDIRSEKMRAYPQKQHSIFTELVHGYIQRKKKYEGKTTFNSQKLEMLGLDSLVQLIGDVKLTRDNYVITSGKADIFLENFNKSLKYFVLNDDVKVTETMKTPLGVAYYRRAFSERLEGFGREQRMVLSGAPRVEHGEDVIKGYKITIRENIDLVEVDDAMSDVQIKKKNKD